MSDKARADLLAWSKELADPDWCLSVPGVAKTAIRQLVAMVEATKPRTITTLEELDALPIGSVVVSVEAYGLPGGHVYPIAYQRLYAGNWHRGGRQRDTHPENIIPANVLHEPAQ